MQAFSSHAKLQTPSQGIALRRRPAEQLHTQLWSAYATPNQAVNDSTNNDTDSAFSSHGKPCMSTDKHTAELPKFVPTKNKRNKVAYRLV